MLGFGRPSKALAAKSSMKKHVALTLLVLTTLGVLRAHVGIERQDGAYFLSYQGQKHDVLGVFLNRTNAVLRQCGAVQVLDINGPLAGEALSAVHKFSPPDSQDAHLLGLLQQGPWLLAELEFSTLNPAVVLLTSSPQGAQIVDGAVWSGTTAPWQSATLIRRYIQDRAPQAPPALMDCFDPAGALFN
jgi:hypothetical protein